MAKLPTPVQPIIIDGGVIRFQRNDIVRYLLDSHPTADLNTIGVMEFHNEDRRQLAQLIGYSVDGYADFDYVSDEDFARVQAAAAALAETPAAETFYSKLKQMQDDLHSIVTRMVADHSYDTAKLAMEAARTVGMLSDAVDNTIGNEQPWNWQPTDDDNG